MTLDEFKKSQKKTLREFKQLRKEDPSEAKKIAARNLHAAGIITKAGKLAKPYR